MEPHISATRPLFERAYPTADAAARLYDSQDLSRAVEAYRFFYPTVSMEGIFNGNRERGIEDGKQLLLLTAGPRHVAFTASSDTPYVAGVFALVAAANPSLSPAERREIVYSTALDLGPPGWDEEYGWGLVNAHAAVQAAVQ